MTPATVVAVALVLGVLIGGSFVVGAPVFAVPIILVFVAVVLTMQFMRKTREARRMQTFREQAESGTEFTARDRETQVPS